MRQEYLTGDAALDATLRELSDKIADKAVKAGVRAALSVITKGIKSEVPANIRKAIGSKMRGNGDSLIAKAGGGVGKKKSVVLGQTAKRKKPGVGISSRNVHWWLMGTKARRTGKTKTVVDGKRAFSYSGANRGAMPAHPAVRQGFAKSQGPAMAKCRLQITRTIERETIKEAARNRSKG